MNVYKFVRVIGLVLAALQISTGNQEGAIVSMLIAVCALLSEIKDVLRKSEAQS